MYSIIWEYQVKPDKGSEFEKIYSSGGTWAELFEKGTGYLRTELFHDEKHGQRYLTIDCWKSKAHYENFLTQWEKEYKSLDAQCEDLTERESLLGKWNSV
jgi:heme-degrading monooxygenase HmoA